MEWAGQVRPIGLENTLVFITLVILAEVCDRLRGMKAAYQTLTRVLATYL